MAMRQLLGRGQAIPGKLRQPGGYSRGRPLRRGLYGWYGVGHDLLFDGLGRQSGDNRVVLLDLADL